jgi:hypothetical protein
LSDSELKAIGLIKTARQAIAGCSMHIHGPIVATEKLAAAILTGEVSTNELLEALLREHTRVLEFIEGNDGQINSKSVLKEIRVHRFLTLVIKGLDEYANSK